MEQFGDIKLYNCDCMELMAKTPDKYYDLAIVDPPYNLGSKLVNGGTWSKKWKEKGAEWDIAPKKNILKNFSGFPKIGLYGEVIIL